MVYPSWFQLRRMSYYRYITSVYKSYLPELNRTLRSSSVPRTVTSIDYCEFLPGLEYLQNLKIVEPCSLLSL